jgi:hypothetical protein
MNRLPAFIVIILWIHSGCVFGQTFPKLNNVTTNAQVSYDPSTQMYTYVYKLKNDQGNTGKIDAFRIDISRDSNSIMYDTVGLRFSDALYATWFQEDYAELASRVVSVGFPALPSSYWMAKLSPHFLTASFYMDTLYVLPGDSTSLVLMSKAIPGIRKITVGYDFELYALFGVLPDTSEPLYSSTEIDSIEESGKYHGVTVGPVAPHSPLDSLAFLDTLKSYVSQSGAVGWITSHETEMRYSTLIDTAKAQFQQGSRLKARLTLDRIVANTELDNAGALSSEAYALLKFNCEYLRSCLH